MNSDKKTPLYEDIYTTLKHHLLTRIYSSFSAFSDFLSIRTVLNILLCTVIYGQLDRQRLTDKVRHKNSCVVMLILMNVKGFSTFLTLDSNKI